MTLRVALSAFALFLASSTAASAQVLQLPSFQFTTVNTTVSVPDRGEILLGGINRASDQQTSRGLPVLGKLPGVGRPFNNRGIGSTRSASTMSARAYIIDHAEMDEAILGEAERRIAARGGAPAGPDLVDQRADHLSRNIARHEPNAPAAPSAPATPTPDEIRARNEQMADARQQEAYQFYEKARTAAASGKLKVSKMFLDMALKLSTGDLNTHVRTQLDVVNTALAGNLPQR